MFRKDKDQYGVPRMTVSVDENHEPFAFGFCWTESEIREMEVESGKIIAVFYHNGSEWEFTTKFNRETIPTEYRAIEIVNDNNINIYHFDVVESDKDVFITYKDEKKLSTEMDWIIWNACRQITSGWGAISISYNGKEFIVSQSMRVKQAIEYDEY